MPRSKPLSAYPNADYFKMFNYVSRTEKEIVIPLERTLAFSTRAALYAWMKSVREASPSEALKLGVNPSVVYDVRLQVVEAGLRLYHKNDSTGVREIQEVLAKLPPVPGYTPHEPVSEEKILSSKEIEDIFNLPEEERRKFLGGGDLEGV